MTPSRYAMTVELLAMMDPYTDEEVGHLLDCLRSKTTRRDAAGLPEMHEHSHLRLLRAGK